MGRRATRDTSPTPTRSSCAPSPPRSTESTPASLTRPTREDASESRLTPDDDSFFAFAVLCTAGAALVHPPPPLTPHRAYSVTSVHAAQRGLFTLLKSEIANWTTAKQRPPRAGA